MHRNAIATETNPLIAPKGIIRIENANDGGALGAMEMVCTHAAYTNPKMTAAPGIHTPGATEGRSFHASKDARRFHTTDAGFESERTTAAKLPCRAS